MRVVWQIEWGNPYTQPPAGEPRVLAMQILPRGVQPKLLEKLFPLQTIGGGYSICWKGLLDRKPPRKLSTEAKQKIRRGNLKRRAQHHAPLFAEQYIAEELAARPDYFGGTDA